MNKAFTISLVALSMISSLSFAKPQKIDVYIDTNTAVLGPEETAKLQKYEDKFKRPTFQRPIEEFKNEWKAIADNVIPEWIIDAKFGIYTHWGVYSIPGFADNTYVRYMYDKRNPRGVYQHHLDNYGKPEDYGYTKFVEQFKAEDYNAKGMLNLMIDSGAKFGGLGTVHHDGFLMWDSEINRWNAGKMGPKRDLYGEFIAEARKKDFKTVASFHHARTWDLVHKSIDESSFSKEEKSKLDIYNPEYEDFYVGRHSTETTVDVFAQQWHDKVIEVIDKYSPDFFFFDGINRTSDNSPEKLVVDALDYYYEHAKKEGKKVVVANKLPGSGNFNFPEHVGIPTYEGGRDMPADVGGYFLVDRAISYPWTYVKNKEYNLNANYHIDALMDMVARGGIYLLSLTPMASGAIDPKEEAIFREIGQWLKINGDAIYDTRRWTIPAEGPVSTWLVTKSGRKKKVQRMNWNYKKVKDGEIRFTQKNGQLYAMSLTWPDSNEVIIKTLKDNSKYYQKDIKEVSMLGFGKVNFERTKDALKIKLPSEKPSKIFKHGMSFKIN
jgi:alpha-L-fucosidase